MREDCIDHGCKGYGLGYATAWVEKDGRRFTTTKHRKVHYESTGEWPEVVRHECDNPRCINPLHLIGGTQVDNMRDCKERGRMGDSRNFGSSNGRCVVTEGVVKSIRQRYVKGSRDDGLPALARCYGISISQVSRIVNNVHHKEIRA